MTTEDQEYNDFMIEATKKVSKLQLKYNMLTNNNQKKNYRSCFVNVSYF